MFGLEDIVCCGRDGEEEVHRPFSASSLYGVPPVQMFPDASMPEDLYMWNVIDGDKSAVESALERHKFADIESSMSYDSMSLMLPTQHITPEPCFRYEWNGGASLPVQAPILLDWATALRAHHSKDVVHGNLTPESVSVVHGRGTLRNPGLTRPLGHKVSWTRDPSDDDVYGARWAATELFRIDRGNPSPTKMSDVYSFACLMLQMLTGKVPYCGTKRSEQVVYLKYLGREPIDAQTPKVADRYVAFMRWCWSPEPEKRPTMEIVVDFIHGEIKRLGEQRD